jgi:predicted acetyltransferase
MPIEVGLARPEDAAEYALTFGSAFSHAADAERWGEHLRDVGYDRSHAAWDGGQLVGTAQAWRLRTSVPGGADLGAAGICAVAVRPTDRRRGVLRALMRRQLDDIRAWGEPLAILWATDAGIYGRFGYGLATYRCVMDLDRDHAVFREPAPPLGRTRLVDVDEALALFPPIYERLRPETPGLLARSETWWLERCLGGRAPKGDPRFLLLLELEGAPAGYAIYRAHNQQDDRAIPVGWVEASEVIGTSPAAARELWRTLFGVDLMDRIRAPRLPPDHLLLRAVAQPRRMRIDLRDGLFLRLVELAAALEGRSYDVDGAVVLEVRDDFCPWNAGRWRLAVEGGRGRLVRSAASADLALDVAALGAAYLGGVTFAQLARAGQVDQLSADGLVRAGRLFRADVAPWCADGF